MSYEMVLSPNVAFAHFVANGEEVLIIKVGTSTVSLWLVYRRKLGGVTMATLTLKDAEVVELRGLVDSRATTVQLPDEVFSRGTHLDAATDWAWGQAREGRTDAIGETDDFDTFEMGLTDLEAPHFRRSVFYRTAGIVASSYREVKSQDAGGIRQDYGIANTEAFLFRQAEREIELLREVSPAGTYSKTVYTLFAIN